jgi:carbon monoxide dehydrogenase subunit G
MAERFGATTVVNKPIEAVFDFLVEGENDKKFSPRIIEISKTTDGPPGVGTVFVSKTKDMGIKGKHEFKLTEVERPSKIRWTETSKGPVVTTVGGYDLERSGEGTSLTFFNELEGHGLGALIGKLAIRSARKGADAFADSIKQAIEAS